MSNLNSSSNASSFSLLLPTTTVDPFMAQFSNTLATFRLYQYSGFTSAVASFISFVVILSNKKLRIKYPFFALLAAGDMAQGLGLGLAGLVRTLLIFAGNYEQMPVMMCLFRPWLHLLIIGNQLSSHTTLLMSLERLLAVYAPFYYKTHVNSGTRLKAILICLGLTFFSLAGACVSILLNGEEIVSPACAIKTAIGTVYNLFDYGMVVCFHVLSLLLTVMTYVHVRNRMQAATKKKELMRLKTVALITAFSMLLVGCPTLLIWGNGSLWSITIGSQLYMLFTLNSTVNLFIYIALKKDFRNQLLKLISCGYLQRSMIGSLTTAAENHLANKKQTPATPIAFVSYRKNMVWPSARMTTR